MTPLRKDRWEGFQGYKSFPKELSACDPEGCLGGLVSVTFFSLGVLLQDQLTREIYFFAKEELDLGSGKWQTKEMAVYYLI